MFHRVCFLGAAIPGAIFASSPAAAYDLVIDVKVTAIEGTYAPSLVPFKADRAVGSCAAGTNLNWEPQGATQAAKDQNAQAVLAMLLTAKSTGAMMKLLVVSSTCKIEYIYIE